MTIYRFDFDHIEKTIEVIKVTETFDDRVVPYIHRESIALYQYTAEENVSGLKKVSGILPQEVYTIMSTAFHAWHDINRGFLWKSTFEQRLSE